MNRVQLVSSSKFTKDNQQVAWYLLLYEQILK